MILVFDIDIVCHFISQYDIDINYVPIENEKMLLLNETSYCITDML